ncbi:Gamma-glutamyl cyclotransferase, AIG2-like [Paenibacillus sp. 1_12]|uniref:gamma-glutamylcyclotransferase family protein n=1 Tax=Paenibacillus sp. 1_12 TaxID=1566278 RepID=UPI0008EF5C84|nr:gamma-glutamylcyclotransferase family protein [Paenibacillus sp. 1_12]SFM42375.1 Gamma-glutamyl cyclotransferase, AIG2-like [Paenibacillus sp. 1_12]
MKRKLYAAYGSNMNIEQMKRRCPESYIVGYGIIEDYELEFRIHANITQSLNHAVPVVVWSISDKDEQELDRYEGLAIGYYRKEVVKVNFNVYKAKVDLPCTDAIINGVEVMVYIMNSEIRPTKPPLLDYYDTVLEGYLRNGFEVRPLSTAAIKCGAKWDIPEDYKCRTDMGEKLQLKILMTNGLQSIGCNDWNLTLALINNFFGDHEDLISFKNVDGKTIITNGNDEDHLLTVDKPLFSKDVWAVYGDDGESQYYTFMFPSEY